MTIITADPTYKLETRSSCSVVELPSTVMPPKNVRVYDEAGLNRSVATVLAESSVQSKENGDDRSESRKACGDSGGSEKKEPAFGSSFRELPHSIEERGSGTQMSQFS